MKLCKEGIMPIVSEEKKTKKQMEELARQRIAYENFREWVLGFDEKTFNLESPRIDIFYDFFKKFLNNDYKNMQDFARGILKSYMFTATDEIVPVEIVPYIKAEDLKIREIPLINKFLNDYIVDEGKSVEIKKSADTYKAVAKIIVDKLDEVFGDVVYLNMMDQSVKISSELKRTLAEAYKQNGYVAYTRDPRFLIRQTSDGKKPEIKEEYQPMLLTMYSTIVKRYIIEYANHIHQNLSIEKFNEFWDVVELYLSSVESRLSEESKKSEKYLKYKEVVDKFYSTTKEKVRRSCIKEGRNGDYYKLVKTAIDQLNKGEATDETREVLKDFYSKIEKVNKGLRIKDENGDNYPANYFVCMPVHPSMALELMTKLQKTGFLNEEQIKFVGDTKLLMRKSLPVANVYSPIVSNTGDVENPRSVLTPLKIYTRYPDGRVSDLAGDEEYGCFVDKVEKYIEEHNLPKNNVCITMIGKDIARGREPLNMEGIETGKIKNN